MSGAVVPAGALADRGGKTTARGISPYCDTVGVDRQRRRLGKDPLDRGVAVLGRGGKPMLGSEPISDRDDAAAARIGQHAAKPVMRINASEDAAAAVKIDKARQAFAGASVGRIDAEWQRPGVTR